MTQPNLLKLAKQGDPQAIEALLNRSLHSKGITAKAYLTENGRLKILLESSQVPAKSLFNAIRKKLISLEIESINQVKIYGRKTGNKHSDWQQEFELVKSIDSGTISEVNSSANLPENKAEILTASPDSIELINQPIQSQENEQNLLSLKQYTLSWIAWVFPVYLVSQIPRLGGNLILSRLLAPELFGLMALAYIFLNGVQSFSNISVGDSIIQNKRGDDPNFLNTAWTIQVIRGFFIGFCCLVIAWPVANFYDKPGQAISFLWLLPLVGITQIIEGFNSTALLTLSRHMKFRKLVIFRLGLQVISLTVMCTIAWFNHNIWALIVGDFVSALVGVVWSHRLIPGVRNSFFWEKAAAKSIFSFGKWILIATAIALLTNQADQLILPKLPSFEFEILGVYNIAITLGSLIVPQLINIFISQVLFPFFSKQAELSRENLRLKIIKPRWLLLIGGAVFLTITIGFGDLIIFALYDERYSQAAWMLPILSLGFWPTILYTTINSVIWAIGQPRYSAYGQILKLIFIVIGLPIGFFLGKLFGFVIAVALSEIAVYGIITYGSWRERLTVIDQDIRATALLIGLIALVFIGRVIFGIGLPIINV
jgi:O-antigen/teichoic acid export membrane protein